MIGCGLSFVVVWTQDKTHSIGVAGSKNFFFAAGEKNVYSMLKVGGMYDMVRLPLSYAWLEAATGPGDTTETIRRLARHRPEITPAYLLARSAPNHGFGMDREKRSPFMTPTLSSSANDHQMSPKPFVVVPKDYARSLDVVGEKITVLASKDATQGYEIFLQEGIEGRGPPPHSHDWDESFYVIRGQVEIKYADKTIAATPGTLAHLPAGTVHCFRFGPGGGEMISMTSHNGQASRLFADIDKEVPPGAPDLAKLLAAAQRNGVNVVT